MNSPLPVPAAGPRPAKRHGWGRRLVNLLVALAVIAVAVAAFAFSYDGVHAVALLGGVSPQLARYYPGLLDAVLVIACVAAAVLRDGRWPARLWAWVVVIVLLAAIGTTDVLHATGITLRHRPTEGVVAGAPVVAVLLAFSLLLAVLRHSRSQAADEPDWAPPRATLAAGYDVPALPAAAEPATVAVAAAPTVESPAVTAPPVPQAAVPAVTRARLPESPIALPAGPRAGAAPPLGEPARELAAAAPGDNPGPGSPPARGSVGVGNIRLADDGPVLSRPLEGPLSRADAVTITPPDGLPVLRRPSAVFRSDEPARPQPLTARKHEPEPAPEPSAVAEGDPAAVEAAGHTAVAEAGPQPGRDPEAAGEPATVSEPATAGEPTASSEPATVSVPATAAAGASVPPASADKGDAAEAVPAPAGAGTKPGGAEPIDPGPADTQPDETGPDETGPDETGPDETGPDETGPDETGPDETGPDETGPDDAGTADAEPDEPEPTAPAGRAGIRYAGGGAPRRTGRPLVAEPEPESGAAPVPTASTGSNWDAEDGHQYAGLVYTADGEGADGEGADPAVSQEAAGAWDPANGWDAGKAVTANGHDDENGEDTFPWGSPPFAQAARLNRVRSTPAPPDGDEDE